MNKVSALYLHIPFCKHLCNYCDFYKVSLNSESSQFESFHQLLSNEWTRHQDLLSEQDFEWDRIKSLYLGGGTPSLWGIEGADFFQKQFLSDLQLENDCEFTMEVDPGSWTEESILRWKELGLNRISIGTQTLNKDFLKIMDRSHSLEESLKLLEYCQNNDWNFSLDFLLGIPYSKEKKRDIIKELDTLLSYKPKHISLYILNARSKYPHINQIPDDEYIREEYLLVSKYLRSLGFLHYEVSNFSLPGFESKHNMKYWTAESVAALGPTGTGYLSINEDKAIRYKWKVTKPDFEVELLQAEELKLERAYLALRTNKGWLPKILSQDVRQVFASWQKQGFGEVSNEGRMILNSLGFLMLDSLMNDLFRLKNFPA